MPEDLSIVGFDDLASSRYLTPPLTTIRQPMRQIGERAVNLLLAIIEQVDVPLQQTLEFSFMLRGSTAAPGAGEHRATGRRLDPELTRTCQTHRQPARQGP